MGPTQSSSAWACGEEKRDYQNSPSNTARNSHLLASASASPNPQPPHHHLALKPECLDTDQESHSVSIHPVYELALCRKIKETFGRGETREAANSSQLEMEDMTSSVKEAEHCGSVVLTQPESVVSGQTTIPDSQTDVSVTSRMCPSLSQLSGMVVDGQLEDEGQSGQSLLSETGPDHSHGDTLTLAELAEAGLQQKDVSDSAPLTEESEGVEALLSSDQADTPQRNQPRHPTTVTDTALTPHQTTPSTTQHPVHTESRSTQTTQSHPGDISLSLPPPRPVMISVSTPPDETSPMFYKFSQSLNSPLTDDMPSSPDLESDASDAGYARVRGRFAEQEPQDGGAAAGAAAAGESEGPPDAGGRRKTRSKKKEKSIDYVLRTLSNLNTSEEKLAALCKKYTDLHEEQRGFQALLKQHQRKMTVMQREKDQIQAEQNRAVMAKGKLESLCRELQKQNKMIKDDSLARLKDEEEKRKQMSTKFQTSLAEIHQRVEDNHQQNLQLRQENQGLSQRLQTFLQQHRQQGDHLDHLDHLHHLSHCRTLELELSQTRLQQASLLLREEQEKHLREKEQILVLTAEGEKKNEILETELSKYKKRYEEFQETIANSSQLFHKLQNDMDKMGIRMKKLDKDGQHWKTKWEHSHKELQDVKEHKAQYQEENERLHTRVTKLESLCRALQAQRGHQPATPSDHTPHCSEDPGMAETVPTSSSSSDALTSASGTATTADAPPHTAPSTSDPEETSVS